VAAAIRDSAPRHIHNRHRPNFSDTPDLFTHHPLSDGNVIYTFYFYDPVRNHPPGRELGRALVDSYT
jgi:hypothetical protein